MRPYGLFEVVLGGSFQDPSSTATLATLSRMTRLMASLRLFSMDGRAVATGGRITRCIAEHFSSWICGMLLPA